MTNAQVFLIVEHSGHEATLHQEHPFEECNTDDAPHKQKIDVSTAAALLADNLAHACAFCEPVPDPSTLNTRGKQ